MALKVGDLYYDCTLDTRKLIDGERDAARRIDGVGREFDKLQTRATKVAAAVGAALSAIAIEGMVSKLVAVQRQFDVMFASLKTVTGGAQAANAQFQKLREFASTTPYSLEQSVQGFVKLKTLGLDPSERALRSFGNTAAAMGKDLNQMIEAVADASTSEFERLKEFGIKAKQEGARVSLTFQGVTTTIGNNSAEIVEYLTKIGEVNFAGAMSERMKTLDGDISNLQDSMQALYLAVSQSGFGDAIAAGVRTATRAIQEAEASVKQGQLTEYFDQLRPLIVGAEVAAVSLAGAIAGRLIQSMIAAGVQAYATATAMGAATVATRGFTAALALLGGPIGITVTALALLALNWDKVGGEARDAATMSEDAAQRIAAALTRSAEGARSALLGQLADVTAEIKLIDAELANTKFPLASPEDLAELRRRKDTLLKIANDIQVGLGKVYGTGGRPANEGGGRVLTKESPAGAPAPAPGRASRETEAEIRARQDLARIARVDAAEREADEQARARAAEAAREAERRAAQESAAQTFATDLIVGDDPVARLLLEEQRKADTLRQYAEQNLLTEQQYAEAKVALERQTAERIAEIQRKQQQDQQAQQSAQLQAYGNLFNGLADLTKAFAGKQSTAYKVLFAASKAFAIADSIIKIQQGIAGVLATEATLPQKIAGAALVASQGAALVNTIRSANYGGGRQYGGPASAGTLYRVNETGRPEMFTAANGAQYMLPTANGRVTAADDIGGSGAKVEVRVHNYAGADIQVQPSVDGRVVDIAVRRAKAEIASEIASNTGDVWRSLRGASNVTPRQG